MAYLLSLAGHRIQEYGTNIQIIHQATNGPLTVLVAEGLHWRRCRDLPGYWWDGAFSPDKGRLDLFSLEGGLTEVHKTMRGIERKTYFQEHG